ncbi:MAG TPA: amidohydrolase family protein [Acidimicrobiia bacterium]
MATVDYTDLGFRAFDADHHYYEAPDAFTRHIPAGWERRTMQWAEINGKRRLLVAGKVNRFIPNPLFDPVARPGSLDEYFRGKSAGDDIRAAFGELEPIHPGYRSPAARVPQLDEQHIESALLFPTLGVGMEEALVHDPDAAHVAFHAFNEWMHDDWTFDYQQRLYAAPYLTLVDPAQAEQEMEWALAHGAKVVVMRPGPVRGPNFSRSPADPVYDGFWARAAEAGITVSYHSGDAGYNRYAADWGAGGEMQAFRYDPLMGLLTGHRPIHDTIGALVCGGVFTRHPRLRVATIEAGSSWVADLYGYFKKAYAQRPTAFEADPSEQLREHVWISPYYEDDLPLLRDLHGSDRMLFGSDYPHAEGLADPCSFVHDLPGFDDGEIHRIMRDNGMALVQPA